MRIKKTYRALLSAMQTLLVRRSFEKITVNDLCSEALISRVTFYSHFNDKYDLLKYWLDSLKNGMEAQIRQQGNKELTILQFLQGNSTAISNLLENANREVLELLHDYICSIFFAAIDEKTDLNYNQMLLSNFCAGGVVGLLKLYVKNKFEPEEISTYFFQMLYSLIEWDAKQETDEFRGSR